MFYKYDTLSREFIPLSHVLWYFYIIADTTFVQNDPRGLARLLNNTYYLPYNITNKTYIWFLSRKIVTIYEIFLEPNLSVAP